jgi:hypothetical protein
MSILTLKIKGLLGDGTHLSTLDLRAKVEQIAQLSLLSFFFAKCIK